MSEAKTALEVASIQQSCKHLHLPTMAGRCVRLAEQAVQEKQSLASEEQVEGVAFQVTASKRRVPAVNRVLSLEALWRA